MPRLLSGSVFAEQLVDTVPAGVEVLDAAPVATVRTLHETAFAEVGLWEMTEGQARDIETEEVFVVVSGHGTVRFADGETITLGPGVAVRLSAGDETVWTVQETIRKIYVVAPGS